LGREQRGERIFERSGLNTMNVYTGIPASITDS
jgi:hypothetical protein